MDSSDLQVLCEEGQRQLMAMEYLAAERTLAAAEQIAWDARDFDALSRLYMPLQEARRQRRQRCGEGTIHLDFFAQGPGDSLDPRLIVDQFPHGQLLIAGWNSLAPAIEARKIAHQRDLYLDILLGIVRPTPQGRLAITIVPLESSTLSGPSFPSFDESDLPSPQYSNVMAIWERLHTPFLKAADALPEAIARIQAYRQTILVDYACELAHQKLSDLARSLCQAQERS